MIEKWTDEQALISLAIGLGVLFVELSALLSTLFACTKTKNLKKKHASAFTSTQTLSPFREDDFGEFVFISMYLYLSFTLSLCINLRLLLIKQAGPELGFGDAYETSRSASFRSILMKLGEIIVLHKRHLEPTEFLNIFYIMGVTPC